MEEQISQKTMERNLESIFKDAYREGAADGQKSVFQASFDAGYAEGMMFGITMSYDNTLSRLSSPMAEDRITELQDPMKMNCQMCLDNTLEKRPLPQIEQIQKEINAHYIEETS